MNSIVFEDDHALNLGPLSLTQQYGHLFAHSTCII